MNLILVVVLLVGSFLFGPTVKILRTFVEGTGLYIQNFIQNSLEVAELLLASSKTFPAVEKSIPAKIENQINETIVGTNITPAINSFIVLPLEILAIYCVLHRELGRYDKRYRGLKL